MKKLIIIIVIGLAAWQLFLKDNTVVEESNAKAVSTFENSAAMQTLAKAKEIAHAQSIYTCDERTSCSQMTSLKEAEFFSRYCPNAQVDKDQNGVVCGKRFNL
jgi:predicted negative regulator of RcsB-dependent stress response